MERLAQSGFRMPGSFKTEVFMRAKLMTTVLILLSFLVPLHAADKSPSQILGGKPAAPSSGSNNYYDGHGSFAGRSGTSGNTTRL